MCPFLFKGSHQCLSALFVSSIRAHSTPAKTSTRLLMSQRPSLSWWGSPLTKCNTWISSRRTLVGFPGGAVVESLPANAGDTGSCPGLGGSRMPRGCWAREPQLLSLRVWSLCSAAGEAAVVRGPRTAMRSGPRLPQLERALAQKRRHNTAINK